MNEQIKEVENILKGMWCDVYQDPKYPSCTISIKIDGDWKHDHLRAKHLLSQHGYNQVCENVIGNSDSDFYTSVHVVMKQSKEFIDALKKMFG